MAKCGHNDLQLGGLDGTRLVRVGRVKCRPDVLNLLFRQTKGFLDCLLRCWSCCLRCWSCCVLWRGTILSFTDGLHKACALVC